MEDNEFFHKFDSVKEKKSSLKSNVLVPFFSGIFGTALTIGVIFGVPTIREKVVFSSESKQASSTSVVTQIEGTANQVSLKDYSDTAIYSAQKVLPSIVGISVEYTVSAYGMSQVATATGSGIIITSDGYILTNNHIISSSDSSYYYQVSEANSVTVTLYDNTTYEATIIGTDEITDLAVIKINATDLTAAELGSSDSVQVGEFVLAVGNPLGLQSSVTSGIVSGLDRSITTDEGTTYVVIQTDCAINSGNSGGALVNSNGQVIGINTLKISATGVEGMGFAIPINDTIDIYEQLINNGKVLRPYIGFSGSTLSEQTAKRYNLPVGIYVEKINSDGAAADSDLKIGDVITAIDGTEVKTMIELNKIKNAKKIGDTVTLSVYRSGETLEIKITLVEMP